MPSLAVKNIFKAFNRKPVLKDICFAVEPGEFTVLVGPSGCGKSTMLRCIAGLEQVDAGSVEIGGKDVTSYDPKDRNIAMVFQDYALYPHKSVYENIAFGLRIRRLEKSEIDRRVNEAAQKLGLLGLLDRKPSALSGGQRQRVAIGRAIVRKPELFLFDEPLSNLDAKLRSSMRVTLAKLHRELNATVVYVTHDQIEAMTLADKIVVLHRGEIQQMGSPLELYHQPLNQFVGTFIGSPAMNLITGQLIPQQDLYFVSDHNLRFRIPEKFQKKFCQMKNLPKNVQWGIRPENMTEVKSKESKTEIYQADIVVVEQLGSETIIHCELQGHELQVKLHSTLTVKPGDKIALQYSSDDFYLFDAETGKSLLL